MNNNLSCPNSSCGITEKTATKTAKDHFTILNLYGTWYEMGVQYGKAMKDEMHRLLAFAEKVDAPETNLVMFPVGLPMGFEPIDKLFAGVSAGSGISIPDLIRINSAEIAYWKPYMEQSGLIQPGQCTCLGMWGSKSVGGKMIVARNYDWWEVFLPYEPVVTCFHPLDGALDFTTVNYAGCLYLTSAMNEEGLFIELNSGVFASNESWTEGYFNTWTLFQVIMNAHNSADALRMLNSLRGAKSYNIGVADSERMFVYEWGVKNSTVIKAPESRDYLTLANHFCQDGWTNLPTASMRGKDSSINRYNAMNCLAESVPDGTADVCTMQKILSRTTENGGSTVRDTLFQIIAVPSERRMLIHPMTSQEWGEFSFPKKK